jgi:hypothetical protein
MEVSFRRPDISGSRSVTNESAWGARSGNTLSSLDRGIEGTTAAGHTNLDPVTAILTAAGMAQYIAENANLAGLVEGEASLGADFTLNAASGTWQDTGLSVTLPGAGKYRLVAEVTGLFAASAGAFGLIAAKMYNFTDTTDVTPARHVVYREIEAADSLGLNMRGTTSFSKTVIVAGSKVIKLYANRQFAGGGALSASKIEGATAADTKLSYMRIY